MPTKPFPAILYYVYDPMCSWCWGYAPTWQTIKAHLSADIEVRYVLGGLAPDSDVPMPLAMQQQIASYWRKIEAYLGTPFNHDFWSNNTPRRSTYPSCRAALAARWQGREVEMVKAIQEAYYLHAKNPSDDDVLLALAQEIGLDMDTFRTDYASEALNNEFEQELDFARRIGASGFPSLILRIGDQCQAVGVDYQNPQASVQTIESYLAAH